MNYEFKIVRATNTEKKTKPCLYNNKESQEKNKQHLKTNYRVLNLPAK